MPVDAFSITQNGKRTISFMSQALGLIADADIGTENLRWMGDTRFLLGILRGSEAFSILSQDRWLTINLSSHFIQIMPCANLLQTSRR